MSITKGKWQLLPDGVHVRSETGRMVAWVIPHPGDCPIGEKHSPEDRANANFISTAPDLLENSEAVLSWLQEFVGTQAWEEIRGEYPGTKPVECIEKLLNAIAKVRGFVR